MKYKDIFFIVDLSVNAVMHANEISGIIKDIVRSIEDITYNIWNIHVNVLTFDGSVFSGKRNILSRSASVGFFEPPELKPGTVPSHSSTAEGAFRAAFDMGVSDYKEWLLGGLFATPAQIIYISDGSFRYTAGSDRKNRVRSAYIDEMKSLIKSTGISLKVLALSTRSMEADEKELMSIAGSPESLLHITPLNNPYKQFFYDMFN